MPTPKSRSIQKKKSVKDFFNNRGRKKFALFTVVVLAAIGAYMLFFASAATNNCQPENGVQICDVDQTAATNDTVLSTMGEAESLGNQGWGTYYGTAFRAPTSAYDGSVPVTRLFNPNVSWHDFVTEAQKGQKEAKAGGADKLTNEGVSFFAWTDGHHPGTVPVYRITRMGAETQAMFSTDKGWVDQMVAGPWGWKINDTMPDVAFYAFPPSYTVAGIANPYDCTILENFVSERCKVPAQNLQKNIDAGNIATTCPKTWADWNKTVNASSLDQACQDQWNKYAQDCHNTDVFLSDRCKTERDALEAANKAAADAKKKADSDAAAAAKKKSSGNGSTGSSGTKKSSGSNSTTPATPAVPAGPTADQCARFGTELKDGVCKQNCTKLDSGAKRNCLNKGGFDKPVATTSTPAAPADQKVNAYKCQVNYLEYGGALGGMHQVWKKRYYGLDGLHTLPEALKMCIAKFDSWKKNNPYIYLHVYANTSKWETRDWQHKQVRNLSVTVVLK